MKPNIIAIATDAGQFGPATFLANKLAKLNPRDDVDIVIFSTAAKEVAVAKESGVWENFHGLSLPPDAPATRRYPAASYIRVLVPGMVGRDVRRVLYLDVDTFPESDALFRLFDLDLGEYIIAGVRHLPSALQHIPFNLMNSGMLLIDREKYLAANLESRILAKGREIKLDDQHAINRVLMGNWLELSPAMNMFRAFRFSFVPKVLPPSLTHFVDTPKPWHGARFADPHRVRQELESYLLTSPWKYSVAQHFNFQQAWDSLQAKRGGPTFAAPIVGERTPAMTDDDKERTKTYLRREFADVVQGITTIDYAGMKRL